VGSEIEARQKSALKLLTADFYDAQLSQSGRKTCLLSAIHSLDTQVCDLQAERFEAEASKIKAAIVYAIINADLIFAQDRYCGANNSDQL
jgi:thiol peroxidase